MAHYFPDDPAAQHESNIASLVLGQGGIWGDLLAVSPDGVERVARLLSAYKQVRDDMTEVSAVVTGAVSGSPEVHEKLAANGRGAVVVFATVPGSYEYITRQRTVAQQVSSEGVEVRRLRDGRVHLLCRFAEPGAKIVFFGAQPAPK